MEDPKKIEEEAQGSKPEDTYTPDGAERILRNFVQKRSLEMKTYREKLGIEDRWKEADKEYVPAALQISAPKRRLEADQDTGLRSRFVTVGGDEDEAWRSDKSDPALLVKIQTALSVIIDNNPGAILTALGKRYEARTAVAEAVWKRNWEITNSKEVLKLFVFDLMKYGWAAGLSTPRKIEYDKEVLTEYDEDDPSKNKYESKKLLWFNDVYRRRLDPYRTWIDEMSQPYDRFSMNDCYYELDYGYDAAKIEFQKYENFELLGRSAQVILDGDKKVDEKDKKDRDDIITLGFYENRIKDLFIIYNPAKNVILHHCPLPNDDGLLSLWHTMWVLRSGNSPYGIGLWEMIKQDKELYDKYQNMTADQLVLSIMKMFFFTGTRMVGDGKVRIVPGKGEHIQNGDVKFLDVPGPGKEAWEGLQYQKRKIDDVSGITPTIEGEVTGNTLGEILHAKEAALKRMKVPLENLSDAIEQDAYITLSWSKQIFSTPEIKEFLTVREMQEFENETGLNHSQLFANTGQEGQEGQMNGLTATYMPELSLHLEDRDGKLYEGKESRFFQVGHDLPVNMLDWKGIFKVLPKSILSPSDELEKEGKMQLFNFIAPLLMQDPAIYSKAVTQVIKANDEDPDDWLPDSWKPVQNSLFMPAPAPGVMVTPGSGGMPIDQGGQPGNGPETLQAAAGTVPNQGAPTAVPQASIPSSFTGGRKPMGSLASR